ncbi:uncharacterized protein ARMOST_10141 [Armillaria ostoyae]|uniref:Uncharacterized protein n=1 Tax=Armillaria ostoyae TaxID=47428 RepID=A0A284RDG0_ARMOS|nr:uncharacterized protein ARMOST_10141 [Armillaria ostoyae]
MANDAPPQSLALSDIMHTLSPSPGPQNTEQSQYANGEERARSLDPPQEVDLKSCRNKLSEMGLLSDENESATPRERELANMLARCEAVGPNLFSEERARWEAEKEGWERSAEALISQRTKENPDAFKTEQMTYFNSLLESDNKAKTEKLQEALARLSSLEAELAKLKPILLLQPFPSSSRPSHSALLNASTYLSSLPYPAATGDSALVAQKQRGAKKKKKDKDSKVPPPAHGGSDEDKHTEPVLTDPGVTAKSDAEGSASTSTLPLLDPPPNINGQTSYLSAAQDSMTASPQSQQYRFAVDVYAHLRPKNVQSSVPPGQTVYSKKGRPPRAKETKPSQPTTLSSDARTEHILLAARKIGRERATVVSSVTQAERQCDIAREQERLEKEPHEHRNEGMLPPLRVGRATTYTAGLYQHLLTPQAQQVGRSVESSKNPPTSLDSLVDVALNMAEDSPPSRRRKRAMSPESPSQKRWRTSSFSALDVLADQAAKETGTRKPRARLGKVAAPRIISPAPRVIERGEEEEKGEVPRQSPPPDADVDADGDIDPGIEMEPSSSPPCDSDLDGRASGHAP